MAFNNMDIDTGKVLFDLCLEQVDRDVGDLIVRVVEEENENRDGANIPDLNEPYDDGHGRNSIEIPMNDDHSSNSNDSIETSVESSGLPQDNVQDHTGQRLEKQDIEVEASLTDEEDRRRAYSYLQKLHSSFKNSAEEESITEESDEENDSSNNDNDSVTDEMYYSCNSDTWDTMSDISDYESCSVDMNSESSSGIDGTIWDRVLAKSPDFCVDNKVASEKSTVESDGNEASETQYSVPPNSPEEIKHGDEMNSAWRNPIIISSSSSDSDADFNTSIKSEDIHLTDDEFEQTWNF